MGLPVGVGVRVGVNSGLRVSAGVAVGVGVSVNSGVGVGAGVYAAVGVSAGVCIGVLSSAVPWFPPHLPLCSDREVRLLSEQTVHLALLALGSLSSSPQAWGP